MMNNGFVFWVRNLISNIFTPDLTYCERCKKFKHYEEFHSTIFKELIKDGEVVMSLGCYTLCELCWDSLGTPEARIPYYDGWLRETAKMQSEEKAQQLTKDLHEAILAGK